MARTSRLAGPASGAVVVGVGLVLLGVAAYVFLALASRTLAPADYAAVASLYFLTAVVGPGLFTAVEQETNRAVSSRVATGEGIGEVVRSAARVSGALALAAGVALLLLSPALVGPVFGGSWALMLCALVAVAGAAAVYVLRGVFGGEQRYRWYSATLAVEGLTRLLPCAVLFAAGVAEPAAFGLVFVAGAGAAALGTVGGLRRGASGPPVDRAAMARGTGLLALASGLSLLVANLGPVVLTARLTDDPPTAAAFASMFVLARTPLFLFAPVQALLLPRLTAAAEREDLDLFAGTLRSVLVAVLGLGLAGAAALGVLGPWVSRVLFASPIDLSTQVGALLGVSTAAMMGSQVLQAALVALRVHRGATLAWSVGAALFVALLFLPGDPVVAAVVAQVAAPCAVTAVLGGLTLRELARARRRGALPG